MKSKSQNTLSYLLCHYHMVSEHLLGTRISRFDTHHTNRSPNDTSLPSDPAVFGLAASLHGDRVRLQPVDKVEPRAGDELVLVPQSSELVIGYIGLRSVC